MAEFKTDGTLTLVNGRGQFRHKIQSPAESVNAFVNCKILTPVNWTGDAIIDLPSMRIVDKASPPPSSGVTYTISSVRSGSTVNFTVKANPLTSIDPVSVTITEYRPGSPNVVINTRVINVAPVNGIGTTSYTISQTQPSVDQKVEGKITNTPSVRTEVTVPKYVAPTPTPDPVPAWNPSVSLDWGISKATTASGSTNITITYNNPDGRPEARLFNMWSFLYHSIQGDTMGECTLSPDVFTLSPGQSKVVTLTWTRNSIRLDRKVGTIHPFIQSKLTGSVAGNQYNWMDIKPFSALDVSY